MSVSAPSWNWPDSPFAHRRCMAPPKALCSWPTERRDLPDCWTANPAVSPQIPSSESPKDDILSRMSLQAVKTGALTAIGQVAITVRQLPRAVSFYRDVLGLTFLFEAGQMAFFDCGGTRLMLSPSEQVDSTYS